LKYPPPTEGNRELGKYRKPAKLGSQRSAQLDDGMLLFRNIERYIYDMHKYSPQTTMELETGSFRSSESPFPGGLHFQGVYIF